MKTEELDTYDQLLVDFQPDLRYIVRRYRKNFHALSEEEIISEVNRRLVLYKDNYISNDDDCLNKKGFSKFVYACAKNCVFWTGKGVSKRDQKRNQCTTLFSFVEEKVLNHDTQSFFEKQVFNAAKEEDFLNEICPPDKIENIVKWIIEYSDFLDERESLIFKQLISGKTHQEIANSNGFTRQMVSLIVVTIFEKVKNNVKVKINTDSSLIKIKKGFKAVNHLFG